MAISPMLRTILNSLTLASGAAVVQLINFGSMIILTRIYSPERMGTYSMFITAVTLISSVAAARYELGIVLAKSQRSAIAVTQLAFLVATAICLVLSVALSLTQPALDARFSSELGRNWDLVGAATFLISVINTLNMVGVRNELYAFNTLLRVTKAGTTAITQLGLSILWSPSVSILVLGELIGSALAATGGLATLLRLQKIGGRHVFRFWTPNARRLIYVVAQKYSMFPKVNAVHAFVNGLQGWATVLIIGALFPPQELGFYFLMQKIVGIPVSFLGAAISQVYFRDASSTARVSGGFEQPLRRVIAILSVVGLPYMLALMVAGEQIFSLVLGVAWARAGQLAAIFAPYSAIHLVLASLAYTPVIAGRQPQAFLLTTIQNILFVGGFWLGSKFGGSVETGVSWAAFVSAPYMLGMIAWYHTLSRPQRIAVIPI